ncbi:MAG: hypothetical protein WC870_02295 [Candidatus Paceibacterota bacterium]
MTPNMCSHLCFRPTEKFSLFANLGILTVPEDYVHSSQLMSFQKKHRIEFEGYNCDITDLNFQNPSCVLSPGDRFLVRAHRQVISSTTTSDECLEFLATLNSHYTGAQGASLVFEQKRDQLPKDFRYLSLDVKDRLWEDPRGDHRIPTVVAGVHGEFYFFLDCLEDTREDFQIVLSFCDVPQI